MANLSTWSSVSVQLAGLLQRRSSKTYFLLVHSTTSPWTWSLATQAGKKRLTAAAVAPSSSRGLCVGEHGPRIARLWLLKNAGLGVGEL